MAKSEFARKLDAVQANVHSFLKPLGFRKKARTHYRSTEEGLIQVVNFQMGHYPIGDYVIPGIRESFYGLFSVNLGVMLPCVYQLEWQVPIPSVVQEYHCTIRERLGSLAFGRDRWFELTDKTDSLSTTLVDLLDRFGLPFVDQFATYSAVLSYYEKHGELPSQNSRRATLEAAIITHHLGDAARTRLLFSKAYDTEREGFRQHVRKLAGRIGYEIA